jgi:hypothetical protein
LISAISGGELSASHIDHNILRGKSQWYALCSGLAVPRSGMKAVAKRNIHPLAGNRTPGILLWVVSRRCQCMHYIAPISMMIDQLWVKTVVD